MTSPLQWPAALVDRLTTAVEEARNGSPTALVFEGEPGMGKSSALAEVAAAAGDFTVLRAESGPLGARVPFDVLRAWGLTVDARAGAVVAAQRLRRLLDGEDKPVLLIADDLQWADEESVAAVTTLLRRAAGDRLLFAAATRPFRAGLHGHLHTWLGEDRVVQLTGLDQQTAERLVAHVHPGLDRGVVRALLQHTGGNPLYLTALLREHDAAELAISAQLPAPAAYARSVNARLATMSIGAGHLARALVVLGLGWSVLPDVVALAQASATAADELVAEGIALARFRTPIGELRPSHALTAAAIRDATPLSEGRDLHRRAAKIVSSYSAALDHRLAAADTYDEELANDLVTYADGLHAKLAYREAAHYRRSASTVTRDPALRQARWLDGLFESGVGHDLATVRAERVDVEAATDDGRRRVVLGSLAIWERRPHEALELLAPAAADDPLTSYRLAVLLAWSHLMVGGGEAEVEPALAAAAATRRSDPAVRRLEVLTAGQLGARRGLNPADSDLTMGLAENPVAIPAVDSPMLAWRALQRITVGNFTAGMADVTEVKDRIQMGLADVGGGTYHAFAGRAAFFTGSWDSARRDLRLAIELTGDTPHPSVLAAAALLGVLENAPGLARDRIRLAHAHIDRAPWLEVVDHLLVTEVICAHAAGETPGHLCPPSVADVVASKPAVYVAHVGLAALWAGDRGLASASADVLAVRTLPWCAGVAAWLRGQVAEAAGHGRLALGHLGAAVAADLKELPLYAAHIRADHSRVAHVVGDATTAEASLTAALDGYRALGAVAYVARLEVLQASTGVAAPVSLGLSERERDVASLVVAGYSYAQIARELFVTQSTVSYHLGNVYAKANVKTRHELTALGRSQPGSLGIAPA